MDYLKKWRIIKNLGEGGQGKVYCVSKLNVELEDTCMKSLARLAPRVTSVKERRECFDSFRKSLFELLKLEDPSNQGALKILHKIEDARDANLAKDRIKREIKAMSENIHPNLIRILDVDPDSTWYVSKFYENRTLGDHKDMFKGDFPKALRAIRPLVGGVARLHKSNYVHRDIKPPNIFLDKNNNLLLGDFGLIYFEDAEHTRVSEKYENVGSRDWMPPWAMGMRIEDVRPNFDVFSLGKVLWSMVTGKTVLQLWYFDKDRSNVELLFPKSRGIQFANPLFAKCIVENEGDCMKDAGVLLSEIDDIIKKIEQGVDQVEKSTKKKSLGEIQEKILTTIANYGGEDCTARFLAGAFDMHVTKMEHYLDGMIVHELLSSNITHVGGDWEYSLASKGRTYLVENDLV